MFGIFFCFFLSAFGGGFFHLAMLLLSWTCLGPPHSESGGSGAPGTAPVVGSPRPAAGMGWLSSRLQLPAGLIGRGTVTHPSPQAGAALDPLGHLYVHRSGHVSSSLNAPSRAAGRERCCADLKPNSRLAGGQTGSRRGRRGALLLKQRPSPSRLRLPFLQLFHLRSTSLGGGSTAGFNAGTALDSLPGGIQLGQRRDFMPIFTPGHMVSRVGCGNGLGQVGDPRTGSRFAFHCIYWDQRGLRWVLNRVGPRNICFISSRYAAPRAASHRVDVQDARELGTALRRTVI